jgi:CheY-like chemotaxis protein
MKKIVLIDDDKEVCDLLKNSLERTGRYQAFAAYNVKDGQAICLKEVPQLVFLDYIISNEKGDEVIHFLKTHVETKDIPIVLMSGLGEMVYSPKKDKWQWLPNTPTVRARGELPESLKWKSLSSDVAREMGVDVYLTKPFSRSTLVELADSFLEVPLRSD